MANLFEHLNSGIQNRIQEQKDQDTKDAEAWREFVRLLEAGEFAPDAPNRMYRRGVEDVNVLLDNFVYSQLDNR